jgi:Na+/melibiose symporter-like transporter
MTMLASVIPHLPLNMNSQDDPTGDWYFTIAIAIGILALIFAFVVAVIEDGHDRFGAFCVISLFGAAGAMMWPLALAGGSLYLLVEGTAFVVRTPKRRRSKLNAKEQAAREAERKLAANITKLEKDLQLLESVEISPHTIKHKGQTPT